VRRVWIAGTDDGQKIPGWFQAPAGWREAAMKMYRVEDDWEEPSYTLILYERE
jgi:hypothetical protein